ncbi:MAG: hypothetical protein GX593_14340 [Actinomycetales bacterium]|nr:hypothetical protein [Actinomycetales bacterium]
MPAVELVDPVGYSGVWTLVGTVMLLALAGWYVWLFWSTRKRPGEDEPASQARKRPASTMPPVSSDPWAAVRGIYIDRLDEIKARHKRGELDARGVHLEIRNVMREFTKVRTGIDAETFTAADAARVSLTAPLAKTLKNLSYPSFARASTAKPSHSLFRARRVIQEW